MNGILSTAIVTLFLCGDIMAGRGIDQILPHSAPPQLFEPSVSDARTYVDLAEQRNGPIPYPVDFDYVWGDALAEFRSYQPVVKIGNLETSITAAGEPWPDKAIHYRMHPDNVPLLEAAGFDVMELANNHVLDWGYAGLAETLETLHRAGLRTAGAGLNRTEAEAPAVIETAGGRRVIVFAFGARSSGIPEQWAATATRPGVNLLDEFSTAEAEQIGRRVRALKRPGDIVVASLHWGGNWGYEIPARHRQFAHLLIDRGGIDLVHGHSSHHVKGIELYRGKLILYGCGDLLTDYEGIGGYEEYRGDLGLMFFPRLDSTGRLAGLELVPMQLRRFRLNRASTTDAAWLKETLNREGKNLGTGFELRKDGTLVLRREEPSAHAPASGSSLVATQADYGKERIMEIHSPAFADQAAIPRQYTCQGADVSPPLNWSGVPADAQSLVLIVDDPDAPDPRAPKMTWVHWLLYNLPPDCKGLPEAVRQLPSGTGEGMNDWRRTGYGGPCPPVGRHRYIHKLYALDTQLTGLERPNKARLEAAMAGHILAQAQLVGTYQKH